MTPEPARRLQEPVFSSLLWISTAAASISARKARQVLLKAVSEAAFLPSEGEVKHLERPSPTKN